jgi:hypothetical protein
VAGLGSGVTGIAAGPFSTCALASGQAYCWGDNFNGQLGDGTKAMQPLPVPVQGLGTPVDAIAISDRLACALVAGTAWCWPDAPVQVRGLKLGLRAISVDGANVVAIAYGRAFYWSGTYGPPKSFVFP